MLNDENYVSSYHHELSCISDSGSNSSSTSSNRRFWKARRAHFL